MCLAQGPQHSDASEARTWGPLVVVVVVVVVAAVVIVVVVVVVVVIVVCLFDLILNVPSTIFQFNRDGSS